jgi:CheY-like chemotaxis protein
MRPITILCVEDNKLVLGAVKEMLELEGWGVEVCEDGRTALAKIKSAEHYDLIITDNELPGMRGLDLIRQARRLIHRQRTPIIILSANEVEREATRAGANVSLRKPEDIKVITETVAGLLARSLKHTDKGTSE